MSYVQGEKENDVRSGRNRRLGSKRKQQLTCRSSLSKPKQQLTCRSSLSGYISNEYNHETGFQGQEAFLRTEYIYQLKDCALNDFTHDNNIYNNVY